MVDGPRKHPPGAGKSSFDLIDPEILWRELGIFPGMTFLDLGCGKGAYSVAVSARIGNQGHVHAIDLWEEGISVLRDRIEAEGFTNIRAFLADIGGTIPIEDNTVDACLMATVLHDLVQIGAEYGALSEAARVLKPEATLAIVEFKKMDGPPGPPVAIRLNPQDVERLVMPRGFAGKWSVDLGPYNYLSLFSKAARR